MTQPVIDAHVHIQPWRMIKPDVLRSIQGKRQNFSAIQAVMDDPGKLVALLDREGIERIVSINYVSPDVMGFTEEAMKYAADFARAAGGRIIPFGSVHPTQSKDPDGEMSRLIEWGFRGIKFHPSHQPCYPNAYRTGNKIVETIYRRAQEVGLVLMVHTGTSIFSGARNVYADPIYCDDIPIDFPKLKIILAHGGRPLWMETALFLVRRHPNMMMDVSGIPPQKLLEYFPRLEEIADKVLWGSDWPAPGVPGLRENVDRFLALPISDEAKRKIVYENAKKLYGV